MTYQNFMSIVYFKDAFKASAPDAFYDESETAREVFDKIYPIIQLRADICAIPRHFRHACILINYVKKRFHRIRTLRLKKIFSE